MKTCTEEMHQFAVVCKVAIQLGWKPYGVNRTPETTQPHLVNLGSDKFGLSAHQVSSAIGQARDFIEEVAVANRIRKGGMRNKPTSSDELVELIKRKTEKLAA